MSTFKLSAAARVPTALCANCGAGLTGKYCSHCGQRVESHLHSLREFIAEATEVLTHADSRVWRTFVPLLFRPGLLTQQYLLGRRASYLPPFRLYIVLSVVFFLVISLNGLRSINAPGDRAAAREAVLQTAADLGREAQASTDPDERAILRKQAEGLRKLSPNDASETLSCNSLACTPPCRNIAQTISLPRWLAAEFVSACGKVKEDNGKELGQSLIHNLGRAMFIFLPLLAALMKILYRRPTRYYVEHLLLLLHNHAFMFFILSALVVLLHFLRDGAVASTLSAGLWLYVAYYLYASMRRVYRQGTVLTLFKYAALVCGYALCGLFALLLALIYSAATL